MQIIPVEWAYYSAEQKDQEELRFLAVSDGYLYRDDFQAISQSLSFGFLPDRPIDQVADLCVGITSYSKKELSYFVLALSQYRQGYFDWTRRKISETRFFAFPVSNIDHEYLCTKLVNLFRVVSSLILPFENNQSIQVGIPEIDQDQHLFEGENDFQSCAITAAHLMGSPVYITCTSDLKVEERLRYIENIASLLPKGLHTHLASSTWIDTDWLNRALPYRKPDIRLAFCERAPASGTEVMWNNKLQKNWNNSISEMFYNDLCKVRKIKGLEGIQDYFLGLTKLATFETAEEIVKELDYQIEPFDLYEQAIEKNSSEDIPKIIRHFEDGSVHSLNIPEQNVLLQLLLKYPSIRGLDIVQKNWNKSLETDLKESIVNAVKKNQKDELRILIHLSHQIQYFLPAVIEILQCFHAPNIVKTENVLSSRCATYQMLFDAVESGKVSGNDASSIIPQIKDDMYFFYKFGINLPVIRLAILNISDDEWSGKVDRSLLKKAFGILVPPAILKLHLLTDINGGFKRFSPVSLSLANFPKGFFIYENKITIADLEELETCEVGLARQLVTMIEPAKAFLLLEGFSDWIAEWINKISDEEKEAWKTVFNNEWTEKETLLAVFEFGIFLLETEKSRKFSTKRLGSVLEQFLPSSAPTSVEIWTIVQRFIENHIDNAIFQGNLRIFINECLLLDSHSLEFFVQLRLLITAPNNPFVFSLMVRRIELVEALKQKNDKQIIHISYNLLMEDQGFDFFDVLKINNVFEGGCAFLGYYLELCMRLINTKRGTPETIEMAKSTLYMMYNRAADGELGKQSGDEIFKIIDFNLPVETVLIKKRRRKGDIHSGVAGVRDIIGNKLIEVGSIITNSKENGKDF